MYLYHNIKKESIIDIISISKQNKLIQQMKKEFALFGYQEVRTPAFQLYDLYVQMNGTINQQEMIKTIDNAGNVLVLRPDITIPLTERIAANVQQLEQELRYFYILDVYRQAGENSGEQENTQIGGEFFGNSTSAADAEIIALSINVLQSIDLQEVKVELGHAGFFKELIAEMNMDETILRALKQFIRAKNVPEIESMLQKLEIDSNLKEIIIALPFLYGKPDKVIQQAKTLPLSTALQETLDNIVDIYGYLDAYGLSEHIVIDLSLINHMDYYSDMIFQGFIEKVGKPVLMGGRYDTLAEQFNASIPAVGFACNLDLLLEHSHHNEEIENKLDAVLIYTPDMIEETIILAGELRMKGCQTIIYPKETAEQATYQTKSIIYVHSDGFVLEQKNKRFQCTSREALLLSLQEGYEQCHN